MQEDRFTRNDVITECPAETNSVGHFFCLLRNREVWLAGRDLLILKRDRRPPMVVMMDFETYARFLHCASHRTTENAVTHSDPVYGFGKQA